LPELSAAPRANREAASAACFRKPLAALAVLSCELSWRCLAQAAVARFRPLLNRVLVTRASAATETAGGIIIPDQVREPASSARRLALPAARLTA